jgi:hypothetical protein
MTGELEEINLELRDASGHRILAGVETHRIPGGYLYRGAQHYIVLKPKHDLAPGHYTLQWGLGAQAHPPKGFGPPTTLEVTGEIRNSPPAQPRDLRARLASEPCEVDTQSDCSPIVEDCRFLLLEFKNEETHHWDPWLTYDLSWVPIAHGEKDETRRRGARGFRGEPAQEGLRIHVPIWWLDALDPRDDSLAVELTAVDHSSAKSPAAVAVAQVPEGWISPPREDEEQPRKTILLETSQVGDLKAFTDSARGDSKAFFGLLAPFGPGPEGTEVDRSLSRVLTQEGEALLRAGLPGGGSRTEVDVRLRVRNGAIEAPMSAARLKEVIDALPVEMPAVKNATLLIAAMGCGGPRWKPSGPVNTPGHLSMEGRRI